MRRRGWPAELLERTIERSVRHANACSNPVAGALLLGSELLMATMNRVSVTWQSWPGAPGITQLYLTGGIDQAAVDAIRAYFNALVTLLPSGLVIQVPSSGDTLDDASGNINGAWSVAVTPTNVVGTGSGAYAGNAGAVTHWLTGDVVNGRRVRGRTFLVPLVSTAYDTAGSISTAALSTLQTAANGLVTAIDPNFAVWHRPTQFAAGSSHSIISARVPDLAVSLRSRRI